MLRSFVPLLVMTFFICLFIVLMQFLWRYIDDLVGKGLSVDVIAELFFYAALTMVPMALPLAILLASLMTFGNLGENFELTAMKASGVSLIRSMRPLIRLMAFIAIGAFFFQNNVLPVAQTKMWTLLYSMRQKSPELDIPEGVFYDQIQGFNIYVEHKNRDTGVLYDVMIYDLSKGFDNASVILADSGKLAFSEDKTHLFLTLWHGEQFENLKQAAQNMRNVPYRRESFDFKEVMMKFDANFNRMDEEGMRSQYVGKNIAELQATIDSVNERVDSIGTGYGITVREYPYMGLPYYKMEHRGDSMVRFHQPPVYAGPALDIDSIFRGPTSGYAASYLNVALNKARRMKKEYEFKGLVMLDDRKTIRRHSIELQKKFTLSFACIIFFFIGAPLGAIIRKGGIGTPLVLSVLLFIVYYIIDNTGYKMAREGRAEVWQGMWLSSAVLLPLGVFFTWKAVNDSAVFNKDAYVNFFRKFFGTNEVRRLEVKEVTMVDVRPDEAIRRLEALKADCHSFLNANPPRQSFVAYWLKGYSRDDIRQLRSEVEGTVEYLSNSRERMVVLKLMDMPVLRSLWLYHPTNYRWAAWGAIALAPLSFWIYLMGVRQQKHLRGEIESVESVCGQLRELIENKK